MIGFILFLLWLIGAILVYGRMNATVYDIYMDDFYMPKNVWETDKFPVICFCLCSWAMFFISLLFIGKTLIRFKNLR